MSGLDAIIFKRLLARDTVQKTLYSTFENFASALRDENSTAEDCKPNRENLMSCMVMYQSLLRKLEVQCYTAERQSQEFTEMQAEINRQIAEGEKEIEKLKDTLKKEKQNRSHKEECDSVASIASKHPSRADSLKEIEQLEKEIAELEETDQENARTMQLRTNQFHLVLFGIGELCKHFDLDPTKRSSPDSSRKRSKPDSSRPSEDSLPPKRRRTDTRRNR